MAARHVSEGRNGRVGPKILLCVKGIYCVTCVISGLFDLRTIGGVRVARYLDNRVVFPEGALAGKRLLDLGAGCGLVSVVAARLGARVLSTDKDIVMGVLNDNLSRNGVLHVACGVEGEEEKYPAGKATVEELWWGPEVTHPEAPFDIIIAAACLYLPKTVPLLLQTLHRLSRPDTLILLTTLIGKDTFVRWGQEVHKWFEVEGRGDDGEILGYGRQEDAPPGHRLLTDLEMATNVLVLKRRELGEGVAYGLAPEDQEP